MENTYIGRSTNTALDKGSGFFALWDWETGNVYYVPLKCAVLGNSGRLLNPPPSEFYASDGRFVRDFVPSHTGNDVILCNKGNTFSDRPVKGCRVLAVASFAIDVGHPMWNMLGRPNIGKRLVVIVPGDKARQFYESMGNGGAPFPWKSAETRDFSTKFVPEEWPLCHVIKRVDDASTAMALAGVRLSNPFSVPRAERRNAADLGTGVGTQWPLAVAPRTLATSATSQTLQSSPPVAPSKHDLWDWLDQEVVKMIVKDDLVDNAIKGECYTFMRTLRMRQICKGFRDAFDQECASVLNQCLLRIEKAERTKLIADWQRVSEVCSDGDIAPWRINEHRKHIHIETRANVGTAMLTQAAAVRLRFLQFARMRVGKRGNVSLPKSPGGATSA